MCNTVLGVVMLFAAFLTAYYTFRLYFRVFQGPLVVPSRRRQSHDSHSHGHYHDMSITITSRC